MKHKKSGATDNMDNRIKIEGFGHLKPGEGVKVDDTNYEYGADLHTESTPLIEPGTGNPVSIRVFEFRITQER